LARWLKLAQPLIAAAHRLALRPILKFLVLARNFALPRLYRMARSKAYLFAGVEIRWRCDPAIAWQ
jgi:hypothetical protein